MKYVSGYDFSASDALMLNFASFKDNILFNYMIIFNSNFTSLWMSLCWLYINIHYWDTAAVL